MPHFISPIVGAYYRPPASTILVYLPLGTNLLLEPEPTNDYDSNAIKVTLDNDTISDWIDSPNFPSTLDEALVNCGYSVEVIDNLFEPLHLGYIPKTHNTQLLGLLSSGPDWSATYTTLPDGKPAVRIDFTNNT